MATAEASVTVWIQNKSHEQHLVVLAGAQILHSIRYSDASWQPFKDVHVAAGGRAGDPNYTGDATAVGIAGAG